MENCNCDKKCFDRVPESVREDMRLGYAMLPNNNEKNLYLYGLIYKKHEKSPNLNSRTSYSYNVKVNGYQVSICHKAFMSIHGITHAKIRTLIDKLNAGVIFPNDLKGMRKKIENIERVKNHIMEVLKNEKVYILCIL